MKEPFKLKKDEYFIIESWTKLFPELIAGFSTKKGGVSQAEYEQLNLGFHVGDDKNHVAANRNILAKQLSFPLENWIGAEQVHNSQIYKVSQEDHGKGAAEYDSSFKATDGFYTNSQDTLLTLCYADCVPLYFVAPKQKMIGTAHAGWKGTVLEIGKKMIEQWNKEGIPSSDIFVAIGPSICGNCYTVDDKVMNHVQNLLEEYDEKPYTLISRGQYQLDLKHLNAILIAKAGVPTNQIQASTLCTSCESELFFSYRRDQGKTGRLLSFIGWKEEMNEQ